MYLYIIIYMPKVFSPCCAVVGMVGCISSIPIAISDLNSSTDLSATSLWSQTQHTRTCIYYIYMHVQMYMYVYMCTHIYMETVVSISTAGTRTITKSHVYFHRNTSGNTFIQEKYTEWEKAYIYNVHTVCRPVATGGSIEPPSDPRYYGT